MGLKPPLRGGGYLPAADHKEHRQKQSVCIHLLSQQYTVYLHKGVSYMRKQRTTLSLPPDLIDRARTAGLTNISEFCSRALEAYLEGVEKAEAAATKLLEEDRYQEELDRVLEEHIAKHRDQILSRLVKYGSLGRKCIEKIRVRILLDTGREIPPARIKAALVKLRDSAWANGDLHVAHVKLQYDQEYSLYGAKICDYLVTSEDRLSEAIRVKAEHDPGLTYLWASEIVEHFASLGITIHNPTVYRVLDTISIDQPAATSARESQHVPQHTYHPTA